MENQRKFNEQKAELKRTADELRARYLKIAKDQGIGIVHIHSEGIKGGLTIAFSKSSPYKHGVMVEVAVNTCSTNDTFSRKLGTASGDVSDLNWTVKQAFTNLYNICRY